MPLTTYQSRFLGELYAYGGVSVGLWAAAGHYSGIVDKEVFDQAVARIMNTERFNPGNRLTAELLTEMPVSVN